MMLSYFFGIRKAFILFCCGFILLFTFLALTGSNSGSDVVKIIGKVDPGPFGNRPFEKWIVHLDLKGAPLVLSYYSWFFRFLKSLGVHGVLIEYEDMFPYEGRLTEISRDVHYSKKEVQEIVMLASKNGLELIPLVQTFGHLEFILKHPSFSKLKEHPIEDDTICPSDSRSIDLIEDIIAQVRALHPNSKRVHIGADEAYHVAEDERCQRRLSVIADPVRGVEKIKLQHIAKVARIALRAGFSEVFAWNDMFSSSSVDEMKAEGLDGVITPVVWGYAKDVTRKDYFPDGLFERIGSVFSDVWFASAYKGANGQGQNFIDIDRYLRNHRSYVDLYQKNSDSLEGRVRGIFVTGWQRFKHRAPLCELLPIGIPSLVMNIMYLKNVKRSNYDMNSDVKVFLNCRMPSNITILHPIHIYNLTYYPVKEIMFSNCQFAGEGLFRLIMEDLRFLTWRIENFDQLHLMRPLLDDELTALSLKEMKKRLEDSELLIHSRENSFIDDAETHSRAEKKTMSASVFNPWPHIFNLANCIVGVSVLAMPFVFQQCGILLAVVMIALCSVLTKFTCYFLSKAAFITRKHSYEALAFTALGGTGRQAVEVCLLFFLVSSIVAFMVVIGDIGPHIVADYLELEAPTQRLRTLVMVLVLLFIIFPLSLIKDLEKFSIVSSAAILFYAMFVVKMIVEALPSLWEGKWSVHVVWWRPEGFLTCLPIVCMALSCQTQLFCVIDCIRDASASRIDAVVSGAINFCSAMYAAVGLFGYVAFYSKTLHGDVLVELESSLLTQMLKLAFMLSIAVSIPLMLFPARIALFNLVLRPKGCELSVAAIEHSTFHILTFVILLFNLSIAILIPNVEFILGLTGSLVGSLVSIIIPSILFISIASNKNHPSIPHARICLIAGCFILLASTWATLNADRSAQIVEKPAPKNSVIDKPAFLSLERLEEQVLDTNLNISAKLDDIVGLAVSGNEKEAARLVVEMKERQKEQEKLIKKQEEIVEQLNKHVEKHKLVDGINVDPTISEGKEKRVEREFEKISRINLAITDIQSGEKFTTTDKAFNKNF